MAAGASGGFEVLSQHEPAAVVALGLSGADAVTSGELRQDVDTVTRQLGAPLRDASPDSARAASGVLIATVDRYLTLVACLAVFRLGHVVVFAPNLKGSTLSRVAQQSAVRVLITDDPSLGEGLDVPRLQLAVAELRRHRARLADAFVIPPERLLLAIYTSGTTGRHLRCEKTAAQLLGEAQTLVTQFVLSRRSVIAGTVPAHHLYGLLFTLLVPLLAGAKFVVPSLFHPESTKRALEQHAVTDLVSVPTHLKALLARSVGGLVPLERVFSSGAVLEVDVASAFAAMSDVRVVDVLGSTESGGIAFREPARDSTYTPLPGVLVRADEEERLLLRSPFSSPDHWLRLGDRVRMLPGGFEHLGRSDGVVKVGGKRVALQEIEGRVLALPGIKDAGAMARDTPSLRGKELWLAVATEGEWTVETLRSALSAEFDRVVLPRRIRIVGELPRNALGKLSQERLLELFDSHDDDHQEPEQ